MPSSHEGTSLTVLMDEYFPTLNLKDNVKQVLFSLFARFPCVMRQYTSVTLDNTEAIFTDKDDFLQSLLRVQDYSSINQIHNCSQPLLSGLKRALKMSPAESIILVFTVGSMADHKDTQLLSELYALLREKKSQVYIIWSSQYCTLNASEQDVLNTISSLSFGKVFKLQASLHFWFTNSLKILLAKPLNSSVRMLDMSVNVSGSYKVTFNVASSLMHLLVTGDDRFTLNFTDPNGKTITFKQNPRYYDYIYYNSYVYFNNYNYQMDVINSYLLKNVAAGNWTLDVLGDGILTVKILGITGNSRLGSCSNSNCHPNATCEEFGGYQQCTCKEGFAGNGSYCEDVDECQDYTNNCNYFGATFCLNTIGSYTCTCYTGLRYDKDFGCVDVDECANSSLNDCNILLGKCTNYYGTFTCGCTYGYYGDGKFCQVNECEQRKPCKATEDCIISPGSYYCIDPCSVHTILTDTWRSPSNIYNFDNNLDWIHCDVSLKGWYRFKGRYDQKMLGHVVPAFSCGTEAPMWMNGSHPTVEDGVVDRTTCASWSGESCFWSRNINVRMCPQGFYVYMLQGTPICSLGYCMESNTNCSGLDCAADEDCGVIDGVQGCYCKKSSSVNQTDYIIPQVSCSLDYIKVTLSKCLLEQLGYETSSVHLRDNSCRGTIERGDKLYITLVTLPVKGHCGAQVSNNGSVYTYINTVYLTLQSPGPITKRNYSIDFNCSYPLNMEIMLISTINSFSASAIINTGGTSNYTIKMGLFQDTNYTTPYTGSEVWQNSSSMLHVGVITLSATHSPAIVVIMKNCYLTSTADKNIETKHFIIKERCPAPSKGSSVISVLENGVSRSGRFAVHILKLVGGLQQVYLHCQIGLCDSSYYTCSLKCPPTRVSALDGANFEEVLLGPINQRDAGLSNGAFTNAPAVKRRRLYNSDL
ncbi:uromodulin-like [Hyperolius riggenbachi]|uniref:uromodulin-like n=1 Tax=Hyperolius riggenbachi TaxID=752182 RepID=UPI0035A2CFD5